MAIPIDEAGELRERVADSQSFVLALDKTYWLHKTGDDDVCRVRDFMRREVIVPLVLAADKAIVYQPEFLSQEFDHPERQQVDRLLVKKGASYEIKLDSGPSVVDDFPDFWSGSLLDESCRRHYRAGNVLFLLNDQKLDFAKLFSCFCRVFVARNVRSALGTALSRRADTYVSSRPDMTAIALFNSTNVACFPGSAVLSLRLEQAIEMGAGTAT